jgi:hypothetical protein
VVRLPGTEGGREGEGEGRKDCPHDALLNGGSLKVLGIKVQPVVWFSCLFSSLFPPSLSLPRLPVYPDQGAGCQRPSGRLRPLTDSFPFPPNPFSIENGKRSEERKRGRGEGEKEGGKEGGRGGKKSTRPPVTPGAPKTVYVGVIARIEES